MTACEKPQYEAQRSVKKAIDTLYRNKLDVYHALADSICLAKTDSLYPIYFDSILAKRQKEKAELLQRVKQ